MPMREQLVKTAPLKLDPRKASKKNSRCFSQDFSPIARSQNYTEWNINALTIQATKAG